MNSKQMKYALQLAETLNFSEVSKKLNISQPALSKQIISLENELGIKIFDREHLPLRLTPAGEHFIREAKELLFKEEQLKRAMEHYSTGKRGRLSVGLSAFRSLYLLPEMVKKLHQRYPDLEIQIQDTNNALVRNDMEDGKLDFAIVNLPVDDSIFEYTEIEQDIIVLVCPKEMVPSLLKEKSQIDFKDCASFPFVVTEQSKEMRQVFDGLCALSDIKPHIAVEVVGLTTAWAMVKAGIGATLLPLQFVEQEGYDSEKVTLFEIKNNIYRRQPVIVKRRGQYLSEYAKYAIELLTK